MSDLEKYKDSWLKEFASERPDLANNLTTEERATLDEALRPNRIRSLMLSAIPMKCRGSACPIKDSCPLYEKNIHPLNKPCPIEKALVFQFMTEYMEELNVNEDNLNEISMVRDVVDQEIQYIRASNRLAREDFIQSSVIGINEKTGEPIMKEDLHQAVEMQERILKRKKDLRNQLLASRQAKAKVGEGTIQSAQALSEIFQQAREINIQNEKLVRQKLGLSSKDDYIEAKLAQQEAKERGE